MKASASFVTLLVKPYEQRFTGSAQGPPSALQ